MNLRSRLTCLGALVAAPLLLDVHGARATGVIVENVQRRVRSRLYERGRYSPTREQGVHHFHRLLAAGLPGR